MPKGINTLVVKPGLANNAASSYNTPLTFEPAGIVF
jgi:hypothetical protein